MSRELRRICVVSGTRAEFGLLRSTLDTILAQPGLTLQLIVTGMHLDRSRGRTINSIRAAGWKIDRIVPWQSGADRRGAQAQAARSTGRAITLLAEAYAELNSDIVLVVGDRVEAFAAAAAAHISGRIVAHIHGGDRAQGIVDDALRHAITKLAHIHFPATQESADRIRRLGEQRWRIHRVGSPGLDDIHDAETSAAWRVRFPSLAPRGYALLIVHPESADEGKSEQLAQRAFNAVRAAGVRYILAIDPNNDPGSAGIIRRWSRAAREDSDFISVRDLPRHLFLGLLRDAAMLVGNSSSGIIEAASFGTPVIDVGNRQRGRERGGNVTTVPASARAIQIAVEKVWRAGKPVRYPRKNRYGNGTAGRSIAAVLARADLARHVRKLIDY